MIGNIQLTCSNVGCAEIQSYSKYHSHQEICLQASISCTSCKTTTIRAELELHQEIGYQVYPDIFAHKAMICQTVNRTTA